MSVPSPAPPPLSEPSPPPVARSRLRLVLLLALLAAWSLPWLGREPGSARTGAAAVLSLAAAWGLAVVARFSRTRKGLATGETVVGIVVAGIATWLIAVHHPWIPGPDRRQAWVPIFGPLAALAALDLSIRLRRLPESGAMGREITAIRAGSALVAAAALFVALEPLAAATAAFLGVMPALVHWARTARGARRAIEALSLAAALVLAGAPEAHAVLVPSADSGELLSVWAYVWRVLSGALAVVAAAGLFAPEDRRAVPIAGA